MRQKNCGIVHTSSPTYCRCHLLVFKQKQILVTKSKIHGLVQKKNTEIRVIHKSWLVNAKICVKMEGL